MTELKDRPKLDPAGCLVLVFNYTGDRLNFGLATEQARREGRKVGNWGKFPLGFSMGACYWEEVPKDVVLRKVSEECQLPFVGDSLSKRQLFLAGVLVLVINYTGDRIHFGLATERARREGIKVDPHSPATPVFTFPFSVSLSPTFPFFSLPFLLPTSV